ncbi:hypothetical protein UA38_11830 [Photobacterium kishitanii]|uniref:TfoX C-terminal domain-containing protein n=1 Tax=Photobacterium kishitanii TaxID=318456 RepID=A0AAX0YTT2_9GAMM|nr:TfoX/Sxy family DNA transformation protein [Photobacterium kishitanii]KJG57058.1 hypothetical protein UA38_11830 [Photobacterium kishitanii]KJG60584.1 hypothetical protein UA42_14625 [Photobacterium kishitanii]KJG64885.1 hypothetical protein UA40_14315 [Photobacterium kishitanii]KJG68521.1 hypothetical protein UA41_16725 [Photobacterium kishitanii]PSX18324.1 hypothetical protein C0W70_15765 [Photobacterium kishitanii]
MNLTLVSAMRDITSYLSIDSSKIKANICMDGYSLSINNYFIGIISKDKFYISYPNDPSNVLFHDKNEYLHSNTGLFEVPEDDEIARNMVIAAYHNALASQNANAEDIEIRKVQIFDNELIEMLCKLNIKSHKMLSNIGTIATYHALKELNGEFTDIEHLFILDNAIDMRSSIFITNNRRTELVKKALI